MSLLRFAILCIIFVSLFGVHECEHVEASEDNKINLSDACFHTICGNGIIRNCYCCIGKTEYCTPDKEKCLHNCTIMNPTPKTNGSSKGLRQPISLFLLITQFMYFVLG
ncbi:unnamed protein product [Arabidopsis halleri]